MSHSDTIVAVATAAGRSGIGVVRLSGAGVSNLMRELVGKSLDPRRATLTDFLGAEHAVLDRGIALYFPGPHSYTGEDVLELQGHGGPVVLRLLLDRCRELGARLAEPGEFTRRAYLNDKLDLAQAEAVADLIEASTAHAARSALHSLQGAFSLRITELLRELIDLRIEVEAALDFPEEEIESNRQADLEARALRLLEQLETVIAASRQGKLLREGIRIVLAGRPNVGKSSLLNRLAGEDLAIVTDIPGTTRDAVRLSIDLGGVPAHFVDTAGLRASENPVEQVGIARSWTTIQESDVVVLILDATCGETPADREILAALPPAIPRVRVMNKIDLLGRPPAVTRDSDEPTVWLSALSGTGVDELRRVLLGRVGWEGASEGLFMARARHLEALDRAHRHLEQARSLGRQPELFAEELRLAQEAMGSITGRYTSDELLGAIFSRFCIGK